MARFMQRIIWNMQPMTVKFPRCNICIIEMFRHSSQKSNRYKPVKLAYELLEPKGGSSGCLPPLIFLHGMVASKESWGDIPQTIADRTKRKAYNLDSRNHGDSEWSDEFDFDLNADDLLHFIDEKGFPKVVIVGHSMGGGTGIKVALKAPERVEMLFVEDLYVKKIPQADMDDFLNYMNKWRDVEKCIPPGVDKEEADIFIAEYIQKIRPQKRPQNGPQNSFNASYPLRKTASGRWVFKANLDVIFEKMRNAETIMAENKGIYEGPSCFLYATKSPYQIGKEKPHILKHFPKAVFVPFETIKHFVHREFPDPFVETVVKFIKQNENNQ